MHKLTLGMTRGFCISDILLIFFIFPILLINFSICFPLFNPSIWICPVKINPIINLKIFKTSTYFILLQYFLKILYVYYIMYGNSPIPHANTTSYFDILVIYISNVISFPYLTSRYHLLYPLPLLLWGCSFTYPFLPSCPCIPLPWGTKPSQDQGPLLLLMSHKAILCYICGWRHGSLHVYSLVRGFVPGSSGGTGWFTLLFLLWGCKPLQLLGPFI